MAKTDEPKPSQPQQPVRPQRQPLTEHRDIPVRDSNPAPFRKIANDPPPAPAPSKKLEKIDKGES